jgi:uncharacterized protein
MLVPSTACPAHCAYCFGPHTGGAAMKLDVVADIVRWKQADGSRSSTPLEIMFHGGEPLQAGAEFYRQALPVLRQGLAPRLVKFGIQSNLWLLTDEFCGIFREHGVSIGTSLDGPEEINDAQRGQGYFQRTMAGIELARKHGLEPGCICTFTAQSASHTADIFDFFLKQGLNFSIHAALPAIQAEAGEVFSPGSTSFTLSPSAHGVLLVELFERYLDNLSRIRVSTFDSMVRSLSAGRGGICTFGDCLGDYLAVGPDGAIYPCQRFVGLAGLKLGNVQQAPTHAQLERTPLWQAFAARQERIGEECGDCTHLAYCRGGCPYNVLAERGGFAGSLRDPHCESYRRFFDDVNERALAEVFSPENLADVVERPDPGKGLRRRGRVLQLMQERGHPYETRRRARRLVAAAVLAGVEKRFNAKNAKFLNAKDAKKSKNLTVEAAADIFLQLGLTENLERTKQAMRALQQGLAANQVRLHKLYLHLTLACPLHCTHCYAQAGPAEQQAFFSVEETTRLCQEAARLGFQKLILTGGEPLVHPQRERLLQALGELRPGLQPTLTTLCTSLAVRMDDELAERLLSAAGKIAVSVDGDRPSHDARRGPGSYDLMLQNLKLLANHRSQHAGNGYARISLSSRLSVEQIHGEAGQSVQALASDFGLGQVKFRPVQPLGRALESGLECPPEPWWGHMDPLDVIAEGYGPIASCGIGQSLCVEPDGSAYPCYAWQGPKGYLGNVKESCLEAVVHSSAYRELSAHTVDSNRRCQECTVRYLCGGACRSWNRRPFTAPGDLDEAPADCNRLFERARSLLLSALDCLELPLERWLAAGLLLPEKPPE